MTVIAETAYAKINLALHVRARRPDGYHEIETLFAFCADGDGIIVKPANDLTLSITGPFGEGLPGDESNLALRAAQAMQAHFGGGEGRAYHARQEAAGGGRARRRLG